MISGKNYIGNTLSAKGKVTYTTFNPKLNIKNPWTFYEASEEELEEAVQMAAEAFELYSMVPGKQKAQFLRTIADKIESLGNELIDTYMKESGLPEGRAIGERGRTLGQLRMFANLLEEGDWVEASIDTAIPDRKPVPKPDLRKILTPIGPVVVFGSSNFPLAYSTAGGDTASALAAGCPVIVKSHPMHAGTGELVASAIVTAAKICGMPDGVFSNLNSSDIQVGQQLVKHPFVKAVGFTGSIAGGTALHKLSNERKEPIPVFAEMGSINPVVILPSALRENPQHLASTYADSITLGTGQFCTNPGLILTSETDGLDIFLESLGQEILNKEAGLMLHPDIHRKYEEGQKEMSVQEGTSVVAEYQKKTAPNYAKPKILTVAGRTFLTNTNLHNEVFGPFSLVVKCSDLEEMKNIIAELEGQLTGTIIGNEEELKVNAPLIAQLKERVGRLIFNGVPTGVEVCPSMVHGGPFPATTDSRFTAVGPDAIRRWVRPVSYQDWPDALLPDSLKNSNPLKILRRVNGKLTIESI
ncbi:aldehyde dehydrogenase (NADP(+)) [Lentiprolixibacter aurantiacus]|uniref:Aldehyde dehydrogenase (NADP(+)) n=1 Tax=Lentiprolixibacter aurantiacus TaxID=2993939 RepID=A0AAE3MJQ5_9FLAO|nr:aldehyde dehydrogenase (NADP(+)) [Lentiprolixibacter aurantiacus]MCX2718886.1 aldehyde dehydrogenase (NADP(+)) [Lentiprolixibacter aurantiacus]